MKNIWNYLITAGLLIFAVFMLIHYLVYKFSNVPTIIVMCIVIVLILAGAILRRCSGS